MSAFAQLQHQLADSVAARRDRGPTATAASLMRWWRARAPAGAATPLLLVALVGLAIFMGHAPAAAPRAITASTAQYVCRPCGATDGRVHGQLGAEGYEAGAEAGPENARQTAPREPRTLVRWTSSRSVSVPSGLAPVG